jgi:type VI secretion system protein ImpF
MRDSRTREARKDVWSDGGRGEAAARGAGPRAELPLLDRLIDDAPDHLQDPSLSSAEALAALRNSVRRDLEALLNARRRWLSWPEQYRELAASPLGFGIPDFTSGMLSDVRRRDRVRAEIEATIRRFEPRLARVQVSLVETGDTAGATLRLRIDGLMHANPAPEPVAFDTTVDASTADVFVVSTDDV